MKISIVGTRGIPARYGGFETCVEEISVRLAQRGHRVTVYCVNDSVSDEPREYKGVKLVQLPRLRTKASEYVIKTLAATALALTSNDEVLHIFGCSRVPMAFLGRLRGKATIMTLDGLEWERSSYPGFARAAMRSYAELAMVYPHVTVTDSPSSTRWYSERTGIEPTYIPYGTVLSDSVEDGVLEKYGLRRNDYILFVGRLVKEKGVHTLLEAFKTLETDTQLVVIGDAPGGSEYAQELMSLADERVSFLGAVYGREFESLRNGALVYVHPSLLDGTSIALLGAMGAGRCVVSSDLKENMDVAGDAAVYFRKDDATSLRESLDVLLRDPEKMKVCSRKAAERASELYDWDTIATHYEKAYELAVLRLRGRRHS